MKSKITSHNFKIDILKGVLIMVLLMLSFADALGQATVTSVSPTRVTTGSRVTVTGSGFDGATTVTLSNIDHGSITRSATEISFTITQSTTGSSGDVNGTLTIDGLTQQIQYVGPKVVDVKNNSEYQVKEVYTNWNGFWRSNEYNEDVRSTYPNDKHDLLGFKMRYGDNDVIFSTGVADQILTDNDITFQNETFKAYSTAGIVGTTHNDNYLAMADRIDGVEDVIILNDNVRRTVYDVLIDGSNGQGLELGTGIANLNKNADVRFFSGNGQEGGLDDVPDLLITQIADPGGHTRRDIYYYADIEGNIVGRPIRLQIDHKPDPRLLFEWRVDLYRMTNPMGYDVALPQESGSFSSRQTRPYRMVAFQLQDFEISDITELKKVNNINMMAGGSADLSFIAYNRKAFDIKSPLVKLFPISRFVCEVNIGSSVTFNTKVGIDGGATTDTDETLVYKWFKNNAQIPGQSLANYEIPNVQSADLNDHYRVRISNKYGAVDLNFRLALGGTPTYWIDGDWVYPTTYYDEGELRFPINPMDRNLIFSENYNKAEDLVGCDCFVPAGSDVTIPDGNTLKLYSTITVQDEIPADENEPGSIAIPAGTFTLENNASLIQTKEVLDNENFGNIIVKRDAKELKQYDYVYWSSPVKEGKLSMIPGATQHVYRWEVNQVNSNQTPGTKGNWVVEPDGNVNMQNGRGYIKRVNDASPINASFEGVPNNGFLDLPVFKTDLPLGGIMDASRHSNLLGNPYPSALNAETFLVENVNLEGFVKVWSYKLGEPILDGDDPFYGDFKYNYGNQYLTYNKLGSVPVTEKPFDGKIASGQGFFVQVLETAAAVNSTVFFNNGMRYTAGEAAYDNSDFHRSSIPAGDAVQTEKQLVWLSLVNENNMSSVTLVGYAEGATNGKDRLYDAVSGSGDMRIYSVLDTSDLLIQGRALPFEENDQVPLGIEILKNGIYKIGIDHLKGSLILNEDQDIYIEDTYNNVIHDLKNAPYSFTASAGDIKDRFVLRYTNRSLSIDDQKMAETFVYVKNDQLYVKASKNIEAVVVYDLTGKRLMGHKVSGYADAINMQFQFPKGVYLTEIKLENAGAVTKKIMN